jgi:anti-sigma factor RsiW
MTDLRGRTFSDLLAGLNAGQHLAVDALVAFVDGELAPGARDRAAAHLTGCQSCAAEIAAQRQARSVVRSAHCPSVPADLLAALRDIPRTVDLPEPPAGLAVTSDGVVVEIDSTRMRAAPLGGGPRWGTGPSVLGRWIGR